MTTPTLGTECEGESGTWKDDLGVAVWTLERGEARPPVSLSQLSLLAPLTRGPTRRNPGEEVLGAALWERAAERRRAPIPATGSCSSSASEPEVTVSI